MFMQHSSFVYMLLDFKLKIRFCPSLGNFADISHLEENFKLCRIKDVCTLCAGTVDRDSLLHMLPYILYN